MKSARRKPFRRLLVFFLALQVAGVPMLAGIADGFWDDRFFLSGANGPVHAVAIRSPEIILGGEFTAVEGVLATNIARWDGTNWSAFASDLNGAVRALVVRGSELFAGGDFTTAEGMPANRIARWDGAHWHGLGSGLTGKTAYALAMTTDGALYVGGDFTGAGGVPATNIARWDGTNWSDLGGGVTGLEAPCVLALAARGVELFAGGFFTKAGPLDASGIARWNGTGWSALGSGVDDPDYAPGVTALAVTADAVYAGGSFATAGGVTVSNVARWNGTTWSALGQGMGRFFGDLPVRALAVRGNRLAAGGNFISAGDTVAQHLAEWDGTNWAPLGGGVGGEVQALAPNAGQLFVSGDFTLTNGLNNFGVWNGGGWSGVGTALGLGISGDGISALLAAGREIYAGGTFAFAGPVSAQNVARWDGVGWAALADGLNGSVYALCRSGGDLFVGGRFTSVGGVTASNVARYDGTNWFPLGSGINGTVYALAAAGGRTYAGGTFGSAGGVSAGNVAGWNGSNWSALGAGVNGSVRALLSLSNGLHVGGNFKSAGGVSATNVARWDGMQWSALAGGVSGTANPFARIRPPPVSALAALNGELIIGGDFAMAGSIPATNVARWDGTNWFAVGSGLLGNNGFVPPPTVSSLLVCDGTLFAGGAFTQSGMAGARNLARWDGTTWMTLAGETVTGPVQALATNGSELYVGGRFQFAGGTPDSSFGIWRVRQTLQIGRQGELITISWPNPSSGFRLQQTTSLSPPIQWMDVSQSPDVVGEQQQVTLPLSGVETLYRLSKP